MSKVITKQRMLLFFAITLLMSAVFMLTKANIVSAEGDNPGKEPPKKVPLTAEEQFMKIDKNADGVLTADEIKQAEKFARLDWNNDGKISLEEFKAGPKPLTEAERAAEIEKQFTRMDADGDGKLTPQEFPQAEKFTRLDADKDGVVTLAEMKAPPEKENQQAKYERSFRERDIDGNGSLSKEEMANDEMFVKLDVNKDGAVTLAEAKSVLFPAKDPGKNPKNGDEVTARFKKLDTNGDGKLTPEEFPETKAFAKIDVNGDGFVTLEEMQQARTGGDAGKN